MVRHALTGGNTMQNIIVALLAVVTLAACGSGSTVTLPQEKSVKVVFSASTSASLTTAVRAIKVKCRIPDGVSVPVNADKTLIDGKLIKFNNNYTFGSYSAPIMTLEIQDTSGAHSNNVGDFAGIWLNYTESSNVTEQKIQSSNTPLLYFDAKGHDQWTGSDVNLTASLKPAMKVTF